MRYFLDTEFIERGPNHPIELISLGIVAEDGREYYAISRGFNPKHASQWVKDNVLAILPRRNVNPTNPENSPREFHESLAWRKREHIAEDVIEFCDPGQYGAPDFWGYFCGYDWVVLCQLFGDMSCLPDGWPCYCHDLRQALDERGLSHIKQPDDAPHDAVADAQWVAETWKGYCQ